MSSDQMPTALDPAARHDSMTRATLFDVLADAAAMHGDREFLVIGARAETIGFRTLHERADLFGRRLASIGVAPGDRVALWMTNCVDWAVAAYGVARCGAVLVAVSTRLAPREVVHMLQLTRPKALLMEKSFLGKVPAAEYVAPLLAGLREQHVAAPTIVMRPHGGSRIPDTLDWGIDLPAEPPSLPEAARLVARSGESGFPELLGVAAILSTSGTTAAPKGVMLRHEGLIREAREIAIRQQLSPAERFYSVGPFYHCSGYVHGLLCNLLAGATYYTTPAYRPEEMWQVLSEEQITVYHGFAIPLQETERLPQFDRRRLALDRAWFGAGATEMARLEATYGARMCELYGLTETGGNTSICVADDPVEMRHDSDGTPLPGVEVRITDAGTATALPIDTPGEICVRGHNLMRGYFGDPDATARAIDAEGWLHTGDMGVALEGGFIKWLARYKDVIRVGGENLSPAEVEDVLVRHASIAEVAVIAVPHERLGEVPLAFVMLAPGCQATEPELEAHCRELLANFKVPRRFIVLDDFPRTAATMRIQKARLREMAAEAGYAGG